MAKSYRQRRKNKVDRAAAAAAAEAATSVAAEQQQARLIPNDRPEEERLRITSQEVLNCWLGTDRPFTKEAWQIYTASNQWRDPFYAWFRLDDAIFIARELGIVWDPDLLSMFVSEDSEPGAMICHTSVLQYKLPVLAKENDARKGRGEQPLALKDISVPELLRPRMRFTAVRSVVIPTHSQPQRRREFIDRARRGLENYPDHPLAMLYRNLWSMMGSVFTRDDGKKLPAKGSPWFLEMSTGKIFPRKGSILQEIFEDKRQDGYKPQPHVSREDFLNPFHSMVIRDRRRAEREELREFHDQAKKLALTANDEDLGLEDFDFKNYDNSSTDNSSTKKVI